MDPECNDWDKVSNHVYSRWRELFHAFSANKPGVEPRSPGVPIVELQSDRRKAMAPADLPTPRMLTPRTSSPGGKLRRLTIMSSRKEIAEQLFLVAKGATPAERNCLLDEWCAGDPQLRREIQDKLDREVPATPAWQEDPSTVTQDFSHKEVQRAELATGRLANGFVLNKRFVIARFIAKGGMGEVYEAEDILLHGSHIALKTILPEIANDPGEQLRFEQEVIAAREVVHPNLCPIYHIEWCDDPAPGFLFLTMKLLPGETLAARLRRSGPLQKEEGLAIATQMADALAAIHAARIVHCDIKSNNVMLDGSDRDLRLWITDFGLAHAFKADHRFARKLMLAGTPGYIAPELYRRQPASRATDLFAFGVVLHEVFTGERPAESNDGLHVIPSTRLSSANVPSICAELIRGCLGENPARRCEAFDAALEPLGLKRPERKKWTRRQFVGMTTAAACSFAVAGWLERDRLYNLTHPLPQKRFVALLPWPKTSDSEVAPMLTGVLTAIKGELARLEAFDRNLYVTSPEDANQDLSSAVHLNDVCEPLGANLALAAAGGSKAGIFHLDLRLLDPATSHPVRQSRVTCALRDITSLPAKAVDASRKLLNLDHDVPAGSSLVPGTQSVAAYTAFQMAESLMKQPNDTGLDAAIEKYKDAVELDPNFAQAYAMLAKAYNHLWGLRGDSGSLDLARANATRALELDPDSSDGHLGLAVVLDETGDERSALAEIAKVLNRDRANSRALLYQAEIFSKLNRWTEAEDSYKGAARARPNFWGNYNGLGVLYHQEGKLTDAVRAFRDASAAAPAHVRPLSNLGLEYLQTGNIAAAKEALSRALALAPNSDDVLAATSALLRCQARFADALPYALKATEANPDEDANWLELGECYSSLAARQSEAKDAYAQAAKGTERYLQTNQNDGSRWMLLALCKAKSGNLKEAESLMQKAASLPSGDLDSQLYRARILELLGQRDAAINTFKACFAKGATEVQVALFPDMQALRKDPRYKQSVMTSPESEKQNAS